MKKGRGPITKERGRAEDLIRKARLLNQQCYVWLHIADKMGHAEILNELFEDFMKSYQRITFRTVEIPEGTPCVRSERTTCIAPEDAAIVNGELSDVLLLEPPTRLDNTNSPIWHFAGGICLVERETCFCEYNTDEKKGGMIVFIDGKDIFRFVEKYPQLKNAIKIAKHHQQDWFDLNW